MIPYGGPVYKPPVQRVDPPSPRQYDPATNSAIRSSNLSVARLSHYIASAGFFAAWVMVRMCWRKE